MLQDICSSLSRLPALEKFFVASRHVIGHSACRGSMYLWCFSSYRKINDQPAWICSSCAAATGSIYAFKIWGNRGNTMPSFIICTPHQLKKRKVKLSLYLLVIIQLSTVPWRHMGEWRYSSIILNLGTKWGWVLSFTPLPLYPRK
jgi:hypothetical protein